ncbi:hypothetical protein M569_10046, partial [Genlisea aurea]
VSAGCVSEAGVPFLNENDVVEGRVDCKGRPVLRSRSGCWKSAAFLIGVEVPERFGYYGISSNLITYLTGPLGQSTASAAANVNAWSGASSLLPLFVAFFADSFLGRHRTILLASALYILGLGCLTLSAVIYSSGCQTTTNASSCSPPGLQIVLFFISLYTVALAQSGHKPCLQAFGADQFDENDPRECKAKSSFFNWWYFSSCAGILVALIFLSYIQDNLNWGLGFGIPCIFLCFGLIVYLLGTYTYRFPVETDQPNPFLRIGRVFIRAARNWHASDSAVSSVAEAQGVLLQEGFQQYKY